MANAKVLVVVISVLAIIGTGIFVFRTGSTFQANTDLAQVDTTSAVCTDGYIWDGSSCVRDGIATSIPTSTPGGSTSTPTATPSSSSPGSSGNPGSSSSPSSSPTVTPTPGSSSSGTGTQGSASTVPRPYKYQLSSSPFAELATTGFSQTEMAWIGGEVLRSMIRAENQGRTELTKSDLAWIVQIIKDSRAVQSQ